MTLANNASSPLPANALPLLSGKPNQSIGKKGRLVVIPTNCVGCKTCELACSFVHSSAGLLGRSRIRVHPAGKDRWIQVTCLQCLEAACAKACPSEALVRNEATGAVELSVGRCVGCGLCQTVCPFGHMHFDSQRGHPLKCDLCQGQPTCAAFCPHQALETR